jgi:hypothetical protein
VDVRANTLSSTGSVDVYIDRGLATIGIYGGDRALTIRNRLLYRYRFSFTPSSLRLPKRLAQAMWLLIALPLLATSLCAQTSPVFPVTSFTTTSPEPTIGVTADFNGDGLPDIASASYGSSVVTMLLQSSSPGAYTSSNLPALTCTFGGSLVAADLNGDGKQDLALSCGVYVAVLFGNGDGTFGAPAYYSSGAAIALAVADLSGNDYPDIAVISNKGQLTVLINSGSSNPGTFTTGSSYSVTGSSILVGDFNGDHKVDLAVNSTNWVILYGNGDGTLQPMQSTTAAGNAAAVDVNHDGITDLVYGTTDPTGQTAAIQTLLGSASGFVPGPLSALPNLVPGGELSLAGSTGVGQFVNLAYFGVGPLSILLGDGQGGFVLGQSYVANGGAQPQATANGVTNLLLTSSSLGYSVLAGNGNGTFQGLPAEPVPGGAAFAAGDINGDGLTDVVTSGSASSVSTLLSLLSRGDGSFTRVSSAPALASQILLLGDFNRDGKVDVLGIQPGIEAYPKGDLLDPQLYFFLGRGDGTFGSGASVNSLKGVQFTSGVTGDFNGDGKLDALLGYFSASPVACGLELFTGNGDGTFGSPITISKSCSSPGSGPVLGGDLNRDGRPDAIFGGDVYLGIGSGGLQQQPLGIDGAVALGDLNENGNLNLVVLSGNMLSLYAGAGDGTFQATPFYTGSDASCFTSAFGFSVAIGNANGPIPGFALNCGNTSDNSQLALYLGSGNGVFPSSPEVYPLGDYGNGSSFGTLARLNSNSPPAASNEYQDYLGSSRNAVFALLNNHTVAPVFTTTTTLLTITPASSAYGSAEAFTATVAPSNATGSVTFFDGSTSLGTTDLSSGLAALTISTLPVGLHSIRAVYTPTGNYESSTSSTTNINIAQVATTTTLTVSPQSAAPLQTVTLTANVSAGATGTVTFTVGSTALTPVMISNGAATVQDSSLVAGTYDVVAVYSGDANHTGSTSPKVSLSVVAPDFTLSVNPSSLTVNRGQSAQATFTITSVGGYSGALTFSCGTLPSEATCAFNPSTVTLGGAASGSSVLTFTAAAPTNAQHVSHNTLLSGSLTLGAIFFLFNSSLRRRSLLGLLSVICLAAIAGLSGCGGGSADGSSNPGTPIGLQSITIAVAGSVTSHNITLPITVQ